MNGCATSRRQRCGVNDLLWSSICVNFFYPLLRLNLSSISLSSLIRATMAFQWRRFVKLFLFFFLLVCIFRFLSDRYNFQGFLDTLKITFDDFDQDYSTALRDSKSDNEDLFRRFNQYRPVDSLNASSMIPPRIHFIWFKDLYHTHLDISKIPVEGSHAPEMCRKFNPDFEVRIWNATGRPKPPERALQLVLGDVRLVQIPDPARRCVQVFRALALRRRLHGFGYLVSAPPDAVARQTCLVP